MNELNRYELNRKTDELRKLEAEVKKARNELFPEGEKVVVDHHERYHGPAVVKYTGCPAADRLPATMVPCMLGNGNVWWFETETVMPTSHLEPIHHKSPGTFKCIECGKPGESAGSEDAICNKCLPF